MNKKQKRQFDSAMEFALLAANSIPTGKKGPVGWERFSGVEEQQDMVYARTFNSLPRDVRDAAAASGTKVPGCIVYAEHDSDCRYQNGAWAFRCTVGCPDCM